MGLGSCILLAMTTKKAATSSTATKAKSITKAARNPKGGLTAEGRRQFEEKDGSNLKPGVTGKADTSEKQKRKGSFLTRTFTHPRGPMEREGEPTRLALSAHAWGETVPKTEAEAHELAAEGRKLLAESKGKTATGATAAKKASK